MIEPIYVLHIKIPAYEIWFSTSRSSGPGGQHANKTSSRITLHWSVLNSPSLTDNEKQRLLRHLTSTGELQISVQTHSSQHRNRTLAIERLKQFLIRTLQTKKKRKTTRPSRSAIRRRLKAKKKRGVLKQQRQQRFFDEKK